MPDNLYIWFWYFLIYAFIGWCAEVSYAAATLDKFVNRGFLNGPLCPIYGFGVCFVILCLTPLRAVPPLLYIGAVLITSLLEFVTGWLLEKFFHQKWWDYSDKKFNIKGYVCLSFSLIWGIGCMAVMYLVQPSVTALVGKLPRTVGNALLIIFGIMLAADMIGTVAEVMKLNRTLRLVREIDEQLHRMSDQIGENISDLVIGVSEHSEPKFAALREKYDAKLRKHDFADISELRAKYEKIMSRGSRFSLKRLTGAFPELKKSDRIRGVSERMERFFDRKK